MVYCRKLKDSKCSYTKGKCILNNPKTRKDFKVCPASKIGKDYSEMTIQEKGFVNSISNKNNIELLSQKIEKLYTRIENLKLEVSNNKKNNIKVEHGGFWKWLYSKKCC